MMLDVILDRESSAQQNCPSLFLHNLTESTESLCSVTLPMAPRTDVTTETK